METMLKLWALKLWASSLRNVKARIRPLFTQARVAASASLFLDGLLGLERRKTGWMRAKAAGDPGPWRQQASLGRGRWEADALRDVVRELREGQASAFNTMRDIRGEACIVERAFGLGASALAEAVQLVSKRIESEAA